MAKSKKDEQSTTNDLPAKVGRRIKALRIKAGYTNQEHFAWDKQISRSQYGKLEKGADMRLSSLERILNAFEISPKDFFREGFD